MNGGVRELPSRAQSEQCERQPEQARPLAADALAEHAEQWSKQRTAEQRDGGDESLLGRGQPQIGPQERRQRTKQHPGHEADVEIEQRRHQGRRMSCAQESFHATCSSLTACGTATTITPASTRTG